MPGFEVLGNHETEYLFAKHLTPLTTVTTKDFFAVVKKHVLGNPFRYYVDEENKLIIITTPLAANNFADLLPHLENFFAAKGLPPCQLLLGLDGQGATEKHIVTTYVSADKKTIEIFDPKASNAERFFSGEGGIGTIILGLLRSLNPFPKTKLPLAGTTANYHSLGTQSFFDGISCGYHNVANILACKDLIERGKPINPENLWKKTVNPVTESAAPLAKEKKYAQIVDSSFSSFIKKAWLDTVMPLENDKQRNELQFQHYFLGWPKEDSLAKRIFYFASLSFITVPIINLVRRPIEFLFNATSEIANYAKNRLINWAPTNVLAQYLRSGLMLLAYGVQGLSKGVYLALRTLTSPITSFQAAQTIKNPVLRVVMSTLSVLSSVVGLAILAFFAAPAVLGAIPGAVPALQPLLAPLAYPFVKLLGLVGFNLSPITAAMATIITSTAFYTALKAGGEKIITPSNNPSAIITKPKPGEELSAENFEDIFEPIPQTSNVSDLLQQKVAKQSRAIEVEGANEDPDGFTFIDKETPPDTVSLGANHNTKFGKSPSKEKPPTDLEKDFKII
ncbi:hypothetical protein [Legionella cardiaca]|uniref:Uncharacterized protein n=1 Tax=Legionella cardiaca TaxID=1071983 RepID=A0ABY8AUU0_9GAMM|nr:hypothetical protein [Legionella cardiaca]WED42927.1 hypothetical protein PXX05_13645 [Legionella cardiaca]